jgi:hypothetical protein
MAASPSELLLLRYWLLVVVVYAVLACPRTEVEESPNTQAQCTTCFFIAPMSLSLTTLSPRALFPGRSWGPWQC